MVDEQDLSIILELQSPIRWRPVIRNESRSEFDLEQEDPGSFSFFNFVARIVQLYDDYTKKNKTSGDELLKDIEKRLTELENSNCQDDLFKKSKDAIFHVFFACKTQMAICDSKFEDIKAWLKVIKKFDEMDGSNKAAVYAIKACTHSLYSIDGLETSLAQIKAALSYDSTTPYWFFIKGYILQKMRPPNEVPNLQEREAFDEAHKGENRNPLFMVYLADCIRETCQYKQKTYLWFIAKSAQVNAEQKVDEKLDTALKLYRESYELKPNCPVIAFKCANGLMRLPPKYQDFKLIKKMISECEKKFPNSGFGNLVCALYHERINKKMALSRRCLEKCVELNVFSGCINLIRIDFAEKKENANIVERLEKMLEVFGEAARQEIIISQLISYYVFVEENIEKACEYMLKYYQEKSHGNHLKKHNSLFKKTDGSISLVDVITDQVKLKLKDRQLPKEKREFYRDFVRQMNFRNVEVLKGNPKNLLEQIQKSAVPKGKNPNKAHSNEAQRNASSKQNRQSNDRSKYASRQGEPRSREDAPVDSRRNNRYPQNQRSDNRPASFDRRPNSGFEKRAENVPRNDAGPRKEETSGRNSRQPLDDTSGSTNKRPALAGERTAVVKKKESTPDEFQMLMDMCREGSRRDFDVMIEGWKRMVVKENPEIRRTVPEEHSAESSSDVPEIRSGRRNRRSEDGSVEDRRRDGSTRRSHRHKHADGDKAASKERRHRSKGGTAEDRRRDRSLSKASKRSHRREHRHRKSKEDRSRERSRRSKDGSVEDRRRDRSTSQASDHSHRPKLKEDVAVCQKRISRSKDGSVEDRRRDRSLSEVTDRSHGHKKHGHKHRENMAGTKERSRRSKDRSLEDGRRDRSLSKATNGSHRHKPHRKHKHHSESEDESSHRRSDSTSRRHRRHSGDRHGRKSHRKHRNSESAADSDQSADRRSRRSHRKHRKSESAADSDQSADRRSRRSHRKHRRSESASDLEKVADNHREKEKHSHHRSKKKNERKHEEPRSDRDQKKSSRRKKESKKGNSDSEKSDSR